MRSSREFSAVLLVAPSFDRRVGVMCPLPHLVRDLAQSPKPLPPCGKVGEAQLAGGADAAFFGHGRNWSAGPGVNTAGQGFWRGTGGTPTRGYGVKLSAGLSLSLSVSASVLPTGMVENWLPTGTTWEIQGDFVLGGGLVVGRSPDGSSVSINLKPSVGFAAYVGEGTTTDSTIASRPLTCSQP